MSTIIIETKFNFFNYFRLKQNIFFLEFLLKKSIFFPEFLLKIFKNQKPIKIKYIFNKIRNTEIINYN